MKSACRGGKFSAIGLLLAGVAHAEPAQKAPESAANRLTLEWRGSERCRPTHDVMEGLRRLVGGEPNRVLTRDYVVLAKVQQLTVGWSIYLATSGPNGRVERQLAVASCDEVAQAMALVISLWVQTVDGSESNEVRDEQTRDGQLTKERAAPMPRPSVPVERARSTRVLVRRGGMTVNSPGRWRFQTSLGVATMSGALPAWSFGVSGRVGFLTGAWRCDALVLWLPEQRVWSNANPEVGGEFRLGATGVRFAYALALGPSLNVQPGAWFLVGRLHGEAIGASLAKSTPSNDGWGAAGLGLEAHLQLGSAFFVVGGGNGLPFGRPRFSVERAVIYQTPPVTWFAHLLGGIAFP